MRYMRCKCGKREAWTTMGHYACQGCEECGTTLAESPDGHSTPIPHDWREQWKQSRADEPPQKERICLRCMKREDIPAEATDA